MHNAIQRDAVRAGLRAALAAYLADVWLNAPHAVSVTADLVIDKHGDISAVVTISDARDVQVLGESL